MKKHLFFLLPLMGILLYSCSKNEIYLDDPSSDAIKAAKSGNVFVIEPSGTDDTDALFQAFEDAKAAGPGSVVKLVEGEYHIGFIEVNDFYGTFKGAGEDRTFIHPTENLPCAEIIDPDNELPSLMKFFGGNIHMTRMSFSFPDGNLCGEDPDNINIWDELFCAVLFAGYSEDDVSSEEDIATLDNDITVVVDRCHFYGGNDGGQGTFELDYNVTLAVWFGPDFYWNILPFPRSAGSYEVKDCYFDFFADAIEGGFCKGAEMSLKHNTIKNCWTALYFTDNMESEINVLQNVFMGSDDADIQIDDYDWGLFLNDDPPEDHTYYTLTGNQFSETTNVSNLLLQEDRMVQNPDELYPMIFLVNQNKFNLSDGMTGIKGENIMQSEFSNNLFTGSAQYGIYLNGEEVDDNWGSDWVYGTGEVSEMKLKMNNMHHLNSSVVDIYLGELTSNCYVVGSNNLGEVTDEGTNNTVVDLTKKNGKPWAITNKDLKTLNPISVRKSISEPNGFR